MSTRSNLIANVGGRVWASLMSFAFVPFYIHFMGIESYGLVGFFTSLLAMFFVLDMGLSTTVNREMARLDSSPAALATGRTLLYTLETIYWALGLAICVLVIVAAPWITRHWLNIGTLPLDWATTAVRLMGATLMLRWPVSLYQGALMGLRRHVELNVVTSVSATLAGGGAVLVLWLVARGIVAFFLWQIVAAAIQIALLRWLTWRSMSLAQHRPRFAASALRKVLAFSAGVTGITLLSVVLTQLDKVLLAKLLPLEQFGYYALAGAIATVLTTAAGAIYGAVFPSFTNLVAQERVETLTALYHKSAQLMSVTIIPAAIGVTLFAPELLTVYTGSQEMAENSALLLSLLTVGNMFLAVTMLPLALQFAFGWTRLALYKNVVAVVAFVPLLFVMVDRFGAAGAAMVWIMLTLGYFLIEVQIMHRRLLPGEQWRWYLVDVGAPLVVSLIVLGAARLTVTPTTPQIAGLAIVAVAGLIAVALSVLAVPAGRRVIAGAIRTLRTRGHSVA